MTVFVDAKDIFGLILVIVVALYFVYLKVTESKGKPKHPR